MWNSGVHCGMPPWSAARYLGYWVGQGDVDLRAFATAKLSARVPAVKAL